MPSTPKTKATGGIKGAENGSGGRKFCNQIELNPERGGIRKESLLLKIPDNEKVPELMKNKHRTVIINIGGVDYRSKITNFSKFPASRLGKIVRASTTKEILKLCDGYIPGSPPILYFDKNDQNFSSILDIYRMNELHVCGQNCALVTQEDLAFWGIDELAMEPCCALKSQMEKDVLRH